MGKTAIVCGKQITRNIDGGYCIGRYAGTCKLQIMEVIFTRSAKCGIQPAKDDRGGVSGKAALVVPVSPEGMCKFTSIKTATRSQYYTSIDGNVFTGSEKHAGSFSFIHG